MSPFTTILSKSNNLLHGPDGNKKRQKTQVPARYIAVMMCQLLSSDQVSTARHRSSSPAQLGAWTLDQNLFHQVYEWNATHPHKLCDRFIHHIRTCIEQHKELLDAIPDGPIPFRGFAKALVHVVKVGIVCLLAMLRMQ
jgi:hypothetical protein